MLRVTARDSRRRYVRTSKTNDDNGHYNGSNLVRRRVENILIRSDILG